MIKIENLRVELGDFTLQDLNLTIGDREYFIILGPTGAGKTVLLEAIAGLNPVKKGAIWLNGKDITHLKPEKRGVSIVYQDHALFPHLSVRDNILYGLKLRKNLPEDMQATQEWLTRLLGISHLLHRRPATLSGGERQKVALARALSIRPEVLLLDEPLSALDPETRESVQEDLRHLHASLGNTVVHVTHDFEEAMALGTRVAVIGEGKLKQVGPPEEIFRRPDNPFVARFALARNIFSGEVMRGEEGRTVFLTQNIFFSVLTDVRGPGYATIRPEDVAISPQSPSSETANVFSGTISRIVDKGAVIYITVSLPPDIVALVTRNQFAGLRIKAGDRAAVTLNPQLVHVFQE
jgi:ABC-type Fe3+/spermidine/putrescine transport system ATPase subunit